MEAISRLAGEDDKLFGSVTNGDVAEALVKEGHKLDKRDVLLIEPLRAMHFIHFTAWCARQKADGGFARLSPDWGSQDFWRQEMAALETQKREIEEGEE